MTKKVNKKSQAKQMKKRTERKGKAAFRNVGINATSNQRVQHAGENNVRELLARGQLVNATGLSPAVILEMINQTIEANAGIGCIVETIETLEKEGKLVITPEQKAEIDDFDEGCVKFSETAQIIRIVLEGEANLKKIPEELVMDLGFRANYMVGDLNKRIYAWAKAHSVLIDQYLKEHNPEKPYRQGMYEAAVTRLTRVTPKYRTPETIEAEDVSNEALEADDANHILDQHKENA